MGKKLEGEFTSKVEAVLALIDKQAMTLDELVEVSDQVIHKVNTLTAARSMAAMANLSVGKLYKFDSRKGMTITIRIQSFNRKSVSGHEVVGKDELVHKKWKVSPTLLRPA